ncbi:unnamed protein product, partial [Brachionus calyciflorus]
MKKNTYYNNYDFTNLNLDIFDFESDKFGETFEKINSKEFKCEEHVPNFLEKEKSTLADKKNDLEDIIFTNEIEFKVFLEGIFKNRIEMMSTSEEIRCEYFKFYNEFNKLIDSLRNITINDTYNNQDYYEQYKRELKLDSQFYPIISKPDGNCLYNSLSLLLFKNEEHAFLIKACSIFTLLKFQEFFRHLIREYCYTFDFSDFVKNSSRRNEWGTELNILSIAIMLQKTIYCYDKNTLENVKTRTMYSFLNSDNSCIRIGICNYHFFPILQSVEKQEYKSKETIFLKKELMSRFHHSIKIGSNSLTRPVENLLSIRAKKIVKIEILGKKYNNNNNNNKNKAMDKG